MTDGMDQIEKNENDTNSMKGGDTTLTEVLKNQHESPNSQNTQNASEEVIYSLKDLEEEKEYSDEEFEQMVNLYEQTLSEFVEGELVVGKILSVNDKEVSVDIGFKSEGVIPIEEFSNPEALEVGDDIEVYLDNVEDKDGQLVLSKKKADFLRDWEKVIQAYEKGEIIQGTCMRRIKGGIVVNLLGVDAFLPGSQIDVKPIRDFDALIGQAMDFKVVKVNELRKNIVVSHRILIEEGMKEHREKILENLQKGQVLEGTVKNITDFGVFLDLGGVDGLLHINDLSWGRVNHPSEIVALDEKIKVQVLDFNEEKDRISLGLKQLQPHPWENVKDKYKEGDIVKGKVVNISDYGTFVELEKGIEGLIHISEMSWTQHIKHPSKILSVGETVETKILSINFDERKISLGLKQLEPDPWTDIESKYPVGTKQKGIVRNLTNFGAFVELEEGIDGLIHISDLSWTKKIRHPGEVLKKGEEIEVVVLNIDKDNRRISLGYKQTVENPWDNFEEMYKPGTRTKGKIVRMIEKGVIVELPLVVDGFVPLSQLDKENIRKPADAYKVGDELELVVIEFNKQNKKIILSEKYASEKASTEVKAEIAKEEVEAIEEFEKEVASREETILDETITSETDKKESESKEKSSEPEVEATIQDEKPKDTLKKIEQEAQIDKTSDEVLESKAKDKSKESSEAKKKSQGDSSKIEKTESEKIESKDK